MRRSLGLGSGIGGRGRIRGGPSTIFGLRDMVALDARRLIGLRGMVCSLLCGSLTAWRPATRRLVRGGLQDPAEIGVVLKRGKPGGPAQQPRAEAQFHGSLEIVDRTPPFPREQGCV